MKPTPPISSPKEEKPKFISICNRGEFLVESMKTNQSLALSVNKKVTSPAEISEKIEPSSEEYKGVVHDKLLKILSSMRDIQRYGMSILQLRRSFHAEGEC